MSNFIGLEAFEEEIIKDDETEEGVVTPDEALELISFEEEVAEELEELEKTDEAFTEGFVAIENIQRLHDIIAEHGLSKSMMLAADPDGYLTKKLGLPAVETLDATPIKDANAQAAMEAMSDTLKKWAAGVIKFFKWLWEQIKSAARAVLNVFMSYEKVLKGLKMRLGKAKFDDAKAAEKKVTISNLFSDKAVLAKASGLNSAIATFANDVSKISSTADLVKAIEKIPEADLALVGYKYNDKKDGFSAVAVNVGTTEKTVKEFGWNPSVAQTNVDAAIKTVAEMRTFATMEKAVKAAADAAAKEIQALEKAGEADKKTAKEAVIAIQKGSKCISQLFGKAVKISKAKVGYAIKVANAVLACSK